MKRAVTGNQRNQRISYEMRTYGTNRLFPEDDIRPRAVTGNQRNQRISYKMHSQWNQSITSRG